MIANGSMIERDEMMEVRLSPWREAPGQDLQPAPDGQDERAADEEFDSTERGAFGPLADGRKRGFDEDEEDEEEAEFEELDDDEGSVASEEEEDDEDDDLDDDDDDDDDADDEEEEEEA